MTHTQDILNFCIGEPCEKVHKNTINASEIETPVGKMVAIADENFVYVLMSPNNIAGKIKHIQKELDADIMIGQIKILTRLENELKEYFLGNLKSFTTPMKCLGTDFQKQCWNQLQKLTYGETMSYGDLAVKLGRNAKYARAVGSAAGANPIIILVPCHRLTAQNKKVGGFSCGIDMKIWLLQHEAKFKT